MLVEALTHAGHVRTLRMRSRRIEIVSDCWTGAASPLRTVRVAFRKEGMRVATNGDEYWEANCDAK